MDRNTIIDGLKMTMELCVFDPSTGEEIKPHLLNDINRATYDACKGALEILERLDTDPDTISRQAAIDAVQNRHMMLSKEKVLLINDLEKLPPAEPQIIRCNDCKHWDGVDTCDVIDAPVWDNDFCSMAERRSDE